MCVCLYINMCIYIYVCVCVCVCVYIYIYIDALKSSGYKENFTYKVENMPNDNNKEINKENRCKNSKRKIIWFKPPAPRFVG